MAFCPNALLSSRAADKGVHWSRYLLAATELIPMAGLLHYLSYLGAVWIAMGGLPLFTTFFLELLRSAGHLTSDKTIVAAGDPSLSPELHALLASCFQTRLLSQ